MNALYLLIVLIAVQCTFGQELPSLDNPNIPDLDEDQIKKAAEEGKKAFREKCLKVSGGEEAFQELEASQGKLLECFQGVVNVTVFQTELDEAKQRGAMEEVFGKYCKKKPELLDCVTGFRNTMEKCLEEKEKDTMKTTMNITESLLDFMCHKDGDRIAMFIAEGGFECIESKKAEIQQCVNATVTDVAPKNIDLSQLSELIVFDENKCDEFTKLQLCINQKLEGCENKTPANVVESLFKYIKKSLPCSKTTAPQSGDVHNLDYNRLKRQSTERNPFDIKCGKNSLNPNAYGELAYSFGNFYNCTINTLFRGDPSNCPIIERNVEICAEEFYPKLRQCLLPKEEKFFMNFVKEAVKSFLDYSCKDGGANLRSFLQTEGLKCLNNSQSAHNFKACLQRSDRHKWEDGQMIIEEEALCKDIKEIRMCSVNHIKASKCGEHVKFVEFVDGFLGAIHSPCSASSIFVNLTLIFVVLFYHLKKYFE